MPSVWPGLLIRGPVHRGRINQNEMLQNQACRWNAQSGLRSAGDIIDSLERDEMRISG